MTDPTTATSVGDVMASEPIVVRSDAPLGDAVKLMAKLIFLPVADQTSLDEPHRAVIDQPQLTLGPRAEPRGQHLEHPWGRLGYELDV